MAHVLIIYTGGTFGMEPSLLEGGQFKLFEHTAKDLGLRLKAQIPEISKLADCDVEVVFNLDSAHVGPLEWTKLAKLIQKNWKKYDGFVVLHGTDTLAFTASALSFLLRPCPKPVILTGAQRPLAAVRTDARRNLISAVEIAAKGPEKWLKQVLVFFDDRLFQGNRVRKRSASEFEGFESPMLPPVATVGTTIRFNTDLPTPRTVSKQKMDPSFERKIAVLHVTPGFPSEIIQSFAIKKLHALVLVVFQSGTAPTHDPTFLKLLRAARKNKLPILLVTEGMSQARGGAAHPGTYEAGKALLQEGCLWGGEMTLECAYVKASWILGQQNGKKQFVKLWNQDFASEVSPRANSDDKYE